MRVKPKVRANPITTRAGVPGSLETLAFWPDGGAAGEEEDAAEREWRTGSTQVRTGCWAGLSGKGCESSPRYDSSSKLTPSGMTTASAVPHRSPAPRIHTNCRLFWGRHMTSACLIPHTINFQANIEAEWQIFTLFKLAFNWLSLCLLLSEPSLYIPFNLFHLLFAVLLLDAFSLFFIFYLNYLKGQFKLYFQRITPPIYDKC